MKKINRIVQPVIFRKIKLYHIILTVLLNLCAFLYYLWDYGEYEQIGMAKNFFLYSIGDRFMLFIISALILVIIFSTVVKELINNPYIRLRIQSHSNLCRVAGVTVFIISFVMVTMQFIMVLLITLIMGMRDSISYGPGITAGLYFNTLLFYITIGMMVSFFNFYISKKEIANIIPVCIFVLNAVSANSSGFMDNIFSKLLFVGHIYAFSISVDVMFWLMCTVVFFSLCTLKPFIGKKHKYGIKNTKRTVSLIIIAVTVFVTYGLISSSYLDIDRYNYKNNIIQNFIGFTGIDQYMFMYLFYQLPLWIFIYNFITKYMGVYGIRYAMKLGSIKKLLINLGLKSLMYIIMYYTTGIVCMTLMDRFLLGKDIPAEYIISGSLFSVILLIVNIILQTFVILQTSFIIWLKEHSGKHPGFIVITLLHIILSVAAVSNKISPAWIPLTQGIYYSIYRNMVFAMFYQLALVIIEGFFIQRIAVNEQNEIIIGKKGA